MSNPYFTNTANPITYSKGRSQTIRDEYALVATGFDSVYAAMQLLDSAKMPKVNPVGTGVGDFSAMFSFDVPNVASVADDSTKAANTHFVQSVLGASGALLPPITGHTGELLATDGLTYFWSASFNLPNQAGQDGKYLVTNGTSTLWQSFPTITWDGVAGKPNLQPIIEVMVNGVSKVMAPTRINFNSSTVTANNDIIHITPVPHYALFMQGVL